MDFSIERFTYGLPEEPKFQFRIHRDDNFQSRQTKYRLIGNPNEGMRLIHKRFLRFLNSLHIHMPLATGCVKGSDPTRNVLAHRGNVLFYIVDLSRAYQHVELNKMVEALCAVVPALNNFRSHVSEFLRRYCFLQNGDSLGLVTGSLSSPFLFNIYSHHFIDRRILEKMQGEWSHLRVTRFLDDIAFSSPLVLDFGERRRRIMRKFVTDAGFPINYRKCQLVDLHKGPVMLTGLRMDIDGRIMIPGHYRRRIRGLLHLARQHPELVSKEKIHGTMGAFLGVVPQLDACETEAERHILSYWAKYFARGGRRRKKRKKKIFGR